MFLPLAEWHLLITPLKNPSFISPERMIKMNSGLLFSISFYRKLTGIRSLPRENFLKTVEILKLFENDSILNVISTLERSSAVFKMSDLMLNFW